MTYQQKWKAQREQDSFLALADGSVFYGYSVGAAGNALGEVVFNTGMAGYQEILTDPSYNGQIVTMTYPEIGNTGVNSEDVESRHPFVNGFIVHSMNQPHNWRAEKSCTDYLVENNIPALAGIDTRALTTKLRDVGTLKGLIVTGRAVPESEAIEQARVWEGLDGQDYAAKVTCGAAFRWDPEGEVSCSWGLSAELPEPDLTVAAFDYGIKWNIMRRLREQGIDVQVVPAQTTAEEILAMDVDGVFLSNGPADPAGITYAIETIGKLLGKLPVMGICLGHQLIGLALEGETYKLKFGHHGCNQPVKDLHTGRVLITSQNHNFSIKEDSLSADDIEITHINLNDNTVEGLRHRRFPLFSTQFHPEAAPGPHDANYLFERFRDLLVS